MAKMRSIQTKIWTDPYVADLSLKETHLFFYLITNSHTNMAGVYEISKRQLSFESKLMPDEIDEILRKFAGDDKVYYERGWVIVVNFIKNQSLNPSVRKGILKDLEALPDWLRQWVKPVEKSNQMSLDYIQPDDRLGTDSPQAPGNEANIIEANIKELNKSEIKKDFVNVDKKATSPKATVSQSKIDSVRDVLAAKGIVKPKVREVPA